MAEQETSYAAIVRTEIAIVTDRIYELEGSDPGAAEALRFRRRELIALQHSISAADPRGGRDRDHALGAEGQAHQRIAIPLPSPGLSETFTLEKTEQARRLNAAPTLRRELDALALSITRRLSPDEKAHVKDGNVAKLTLSLGISREQGVLLSRVQAHVQALQGQAQRLRRDLAPANQLDIRR